MLKPTYSDARCQIESEAFGQLHAFMRTLTKEEFAVFQKHPTEYPGAKEIFTRYTQRRAEIGEPMENIK